MRRSSNSDQTLPVPPFPPAKTDEERENQLISLAIDRAEQQLRDGTASSQVITHYLKLASSKERLENELIKKEIELKNAKTEALQSAKRVEELYSKALDAFKTYNGVEEFYEDEDLY